jgi:hypothetical protein
VLPAEAAGCHRQLLVLLLLLPEGVGSANDVIVVYWKICYSSIEDVQCYADSSS